MQTLSIWPSNGDFWALPQLKYELGFSCLPSSRKMRRKTLGFNNGPFCHGRSTDLLLVTNKPRGLSNGGCCGSTNFDLGCRFLSRSSRIKIIYFCDPNKGSLGTPTALAWALEQEAVGNELGKDETKLMNGGLLGKSGSDENANFIDSDRVEDSDDNKDGGKKNVGNKSEEVKEERGSRIDVRALAQSLHFAETANDVEEILKGKGELPLQVYSSIIKGFGMDKRLNSALILVEWLKRKKDENCSFIGPNVFIYNSLLGAVKQSAQYDQMEIVMNDMAHEGVVPNVVTYNTLMAIYMEQGRASEALTILDEIRQKGLSPSPVSYSTALLAYRKMEDGVGALKFLVELREKNKNGEIGDGTENWKNEFFKLDKLTIVICFQVMRRWLVKGGHLSTNVLKLLKDMDEAGLQPDQAEHERLVWACTDEGHYIVAKELYNRIRERHSEMSLSVCNHLIWLMGKAKKWWAALEIYEDLLDKGPKPNNLSYELILSHFNILLNAARKRGIWKWGVRLLNKMQEKGLKPGSRELNAVLVACSKASETSAAVEIFTRMVEQGEKPTIVSYGALLSALEKGKLYDEAFRVWEHMIKLGLEPNLYAYTIMASICIGKGKFNLLDSVIRDMKASKIEPTVVTYNAIISACARNGLSSVAYEWFHRMKVQDILPNEISYEMLIQGLAKDGKPRLAYELYLRARNEGLNLSSKAYDAVLQSSKAYGATIELSVLGHRPVDQRKKVQIRKSSSEVL